MPMISNPRLAIPFILQIQKDPKESSVLGLLEPLGRDLRESVADAQHFQVRYIYKARINLWDDSLGFYSQLKLPIAFTKILKRDYYYSVL
jgi:hypothetical protein